MILSRAKPASLKQETLSVASSKEKQKAPDLNEFVDKRDYTGAIAILKFERESGKATIQTDLWLGYCYFHVGDYKRSFEEYERLLAKPDCPNNVYVFLGCCQFFLGMCQEASETAAKDEKQLMVHHQQLQDCLEDQLCLASIHYMRSHYQEAIDIYKRILLSNRNFVALNVYLALCYYKLDYYDVSLEVLQIYLQQFPDSAIAHNLKACNHFKLYNGQAAEAELKSMKSVTSPTFYYAQDIIKHNMVVFREGEGALQVFPPLVDAFSEARLNLVIYYLKREELQEAYELMKDVEPKVSQEYILKAIVYCLIGQQQMSQEDLKLAQQYFHLVGGSAAECDTIPGRQCMTSCYFLLKQFEEVIVYLNSIKNYFIGDDTFNYNLGQAEAALGHYKEAEEALLSVQSERLKQDYVYLSTLVRSYIMNKKAKLCWDLYLRMDASSESFTLLQLIANDCYKMGEFFYAAKAFDVLEKLDTNPEFWEGKRGAIAGVFQLVVAGKESPELLRETLPLLQNSSNPQAEEIGEIIMTWVRDHNTVE